MIGFSPSGNESSESIESINSKLTNSDGVVFGRDLVTTAGTSQRLNGGDSQTIPSNKELAIQALHDNTGIVYVGDGSVTAQNGYPLKAGQVVNLSITDVSFVSIDADVGGEGVSWIVEASG